MLQNKIFGISRISEQELELSTEVLQVFLEINSSKFMYSRKNLRIVVKIYASLSLDTVFGYLPF